MKKSLFRLVSHLGLVLVIINLHTQRVYPQWSNNPQVNDLVTTYSNNQNQLQALSDGAGGVYIVWQDDRNSAASGWDIYAQRLSHNGEQLWDEGGLVLCNAEAAQSVPFLISDGSGGILVFWTDFRAGHLDIYAQRVNSYGETQWTTNGIPVADESGSQRFYLWGSGGHYRKFPSIIPDGQGGAFFAYSSDEDGDYDIYSQRINKNGERLWGINGVQVTNLTRDDLAQRIVSDNHGGIIVVWENFKNFEIPYLYAQRLNQNGEKLWLPEDGINIVPEPAKFSNGFDSRPGDPEVAADGFGGAIILFHTNPGVSNGDLYMQRLDQNGNILWGKSGKVLSNHDQIEIHYSIIPKGGGEFYTVWTDQRASYWDGPTFIQGTHYDIYAQKIDLNGNRLWVPETGVPVCIYDGVQYTPEAIVDPYGDLIVGWRDDRNTIAPGITGRDIYAQKVKSDGSIAWIIGGVGGGTLDGDDSGVPICNALNDQFEPQLALSSALGFIITWVDNRDGDNDIFASFANYSNGELGGENFVLPVHWLHTQAIQSGKNVLINWSTSWEKDNQEFELLHSSNGLDYDKIGLVPGKGEGEFKGVTKYQFVHRDPNFGLNYYKIKQVDVDGKLDFSPVFSSGFKSTTLMELFPNPTTDKLNLRSEQPISHIKIYSLRGSVLKQIDINELKRVDLDLSGLIPGQYFIEMQCGSENIQKSFIKK